MRKKIEPRRRRRKTDNWKKKFNTSHTARKNRSDGIVSGPFLFFSVFSVFSVFSEVRR
jgi:hypothetical protein